jgi:hypothetical protein
MVVCSSSPAVASRCVHLRAGVGAVASQNVTNPHLGTVALDALADGADAHTALETTIAGESHADYRQLIVVDASGRAAIHTGAKALGIRHEVSAENAAAAGNMLADEAVVSRRPIGGHPLADGADRDAQEGRDVPMLPALVDAGDGQPPAGLQLKSRSLVFHPRTVRS